MMNKNTKKLIVFITILVIVAVVISTRGNLKLFTGKLIGQFAFFEEAPSKEKVIDKAFITSQDAASILINTALKTKRIDSGVAKDLVQQFSSTKKITRAELASMVVKIFKLELTGIGPTISDVADNDPYMWAVYLCISNGCLDVDFKPYNNATQSFVEKVASNLSKRFQ